MEVLMTTIGVPPSKPWLAGITRSFGIREDHPSVVRILEILQKKEATGDVTVAERKEFHVLNDELLEAHEFIHGKIIHPTGEVAYYPPLPVREKIVSAVDKMIEEEKRT
jgi:hypothetical protein